MLQTTTFQERLKHCVQQVGTQNEFLEKVSLSRSQLFRYLEGESFPTLDKLHNFSEASNVDLAWLTTGRGSPCKTENPSLSFSYDLMEQVIKAVEEALMEYQGPALTPAQKSVIIPLIQAEMAHEKDITKQKNGLSKEEATYMLNFLEGVKYSNALDAYKDFSIKQMHSNESDQPQEEVERFTNIVNSASIDYFSSEVSKFYYQRTKDIITPYNKTLLLKVMESLFTHIKTPKVKMLDLGCGSGRYMDYIHSNFSDRIDVHGIEPSTVPYQMCKQKEAMKELPENSVHQATAQKLPYEDGSFQFLFSKAMLHWIPFFKHLPIGANKVFSEARRVLETGGIFYVDMRLGDGYREYVPFNQTYSKSDIQYLAKKHGFKVLWIHSEEEPYFNDLPECTAFIKKYQQFIRACLIKA